MSEKNKNTKRLLKDFIRYRQNRMTGEERNSFERELQKDPFAEEAAEGFSQHSADAIEEDILILQRRLVNKMNRRPVMIFYRMAAAVTVLIVVSAIFIVSQKKNKVVTLSENMIQKVETPFSIKVPEPVTVPAVKSSDEVQVLPPPVLPELKSDDRIASAREEDLKAAEKQNEVSEQSTLKDSEVITPDIAILAAGESATKSTATATESNLDIARAASAPAAVKSESFIDYLAPQPVVGKDSFDIYLEKNIRIPEPKVSEQQVVIVSFKVRADSTITGIRIIDSPGQLWSDEAIRLIKDGPAWKPAVKNGMTIEDEVSVRLVFR